MANDSAQLASVGRRVRIARGLAGVTQQQLADRAHVSLSLVKQVEQARVPASPAFVAATARALGVSPADLLGGQAERNDRAGHRVHAVIPALRKEIAFHSAAIDPGVRPRPFAELIDAVAAASALRQEADLYRLGVELPGLLAELRAAAVQQVDHDRDTVFALLAETYAAAGQVVYKLGYSDLSLMTTERVEWAAATSNDALAQAAAAFYRAGEFIGIGEWATALDHLDSARSAIAGEVASGDERALAMLGVLHLKSALAAARSGAPDVADDHLAEARHAATHVTPGSDHYRLAFDLDSVNIWSVGLAVESRNGAEALNRAGSFSIGPTAPRERVGHHWIDLARGYQLHGDRERTLDALRRAREISPTQTRFHPQVRETIVTLVEQQRRHSAGLTDFARWAGIAV